MNLFQGIAIAGAAFCALNLVVALWRRDTHASLGWFCAALWAVLAATK